MSNPELTHGERLAVLERQMFDLNERYDSDVAEIKADIKAILARFNQMSGGQKAWFGLAAILGTAVGIVTTALTMLFTHK